MIPVQTWTEKLNKVDGNIYVIEEEIKLVNGVYEAELQHDNINVSTLAVYTGSKLTGERIQTYTLSTPSLTPWKRVIRVYASVPTVYISYETDGDTVEALDINRVQESIEITQNALNEEEKRAKAAEQQLKTGIESETKRAKAAEQVLGDALNIETGRAKAAEEQLTDDLSYEAERAKSAEAKVASDLQTEASRAQKKEGELGTSLQSEITRAKAAEKGNSDAITAESTRAAAKENELQQTIQTEKARAEAAESSIRSTISTSRPVWEDKYTRNEIDNKFSVLETSIDWKESVNTFTDISKTYPDPDDGWTVNVKDTDYTYRWNGAAWVAISANAIPKATQSLDGLLSKEDKTNYDNANARKHDHGNKAVIDKITQALLDNWSAAYTHISDAVKHITATERTNWNTAFTHTSNKSNPHSVTKSQVGLGSVPDVATNDQVPTYTQAGSFENLVSGEKLSVSLGKTMKAITELIAHKADTVGHITAAERTNWNDANSRKHDHSNKAVIDKITQVLVDSWNSAYTHIGNKSNPHAVTKSQTGLDKVENTADADKPVSTAQAAALDEKVDKVIGKGLSANDYSNTEKAMVADANARKHDHSNKLVLDKMTQALLDNWNSAYSHISDTIKHITAAERTNWTDAYNKRHEHGNPAILDGITQALIDTWNTVSNKVDKVPGKGLSANDYTAAEKTRLAGIAPGAEVNVQPDWNETDTASDAYIKAKPTSMPASDVAAWAKTSAKPAYGWTEITGKPASFVPSAHTHSKSQITDMPTKVSQFENDKGFLTSADIDTSQNHTHANKAVLDKITQALMDKWNSALTSLPAHKHVKADVLDFPSSMPADGGNSATVNGHSVNADVPAGAKFTDTVYMHPSYTAKSSGLYKVTVDASGHVSAAAAVAKTDITGLGIPAQDTTYGVATASANGLMSGADKAKMDGIAAGANNYAHPGSGATAGIYRSVTINAQGHVTGGSNPTTLAGYGITDAASKTHDHDGVYLKPGAVTWGDLKGV